MTEPVDVSVIVPAYNADRTLRRALASVKAQTAAPREVIIVDDRSTDSTVEIAEQFARSCREGEAVVIRLLANRGPGSARNRGWERARGEYIAFLDADDAWYPEKLELQYAWMAAHPNIEVTGHGRDELPSETALAKTLPASSICAHRLSKVSVLLRNPFSTPTVMLRRTLPHRFTEGKRHAEDYLLWVQIVADGIPAAYLEVPLAAIFKPAYGGGGLSGGLWLMEKGELATYWQLWRERRIGAVATGLLSVYSLTKFLRRRLRTLVGNGR